MHATPHHPEEVPAFWFPDTGFWTDQQRFAQWVYDRMQGGMDHEIRTRFADLTLAAARREIDQ